MSDDWQSVISPEVSPGCIFAIISGSLVGVFLLLVALVYFTIPYFQRRHARAAAAKRCQNDIELQVPPYVPAPRSHQSYDSARDGFAPTPVYGGSRADSVRSLISFRTVSAADMAPPTYTQEVDLGDRRRALSLDALEAMPIPEGLEAVTASEKSAGRALEGGEHTVRAEATATTFTLSEDDDEPHTILATEGGGSTVCASQIGLGFTCDSVVDQAIETLPHPEKTATNESEQIWGNEAVKPREAV